MRPVQVDSNANNRILIIDDDEGICDSYRSILAPSESTTMELETLFGKEEESGLTQEIYFDLTVANQGQQGYQLVKEAIEQESAFCVAFIDMRMPPGWDGLETAKAIRKLDPNIYIVIVTAYADKSADELHQALKRDVLLLRKPFLSEEIYQLARNLSTSWNRDRQLLWQQKYISSITNSISNGLLVLDCNAQVEWANPAASRIWKLPIEQLMGKTLVEMIGKTENINNILALLCRRSLDGDQEDDLSLLESDQMPAASTMGQNSGVNSQIEFEREIQLEDGSLRLLHINASSLQSLVDSHRLQVQGVVLVIRDITDFVHAQTQQAILQEQLYSLQKMGSIGALAGGIAHDFNNLLAPIIAYSNKWTSKLESDHPQYPAFDKILQAARRAQELVAQINNFSRSNSKIKKKVDLTAIINEAHELLRASVPDSIKMDVIISKQLPMVEVDPTQIYQVLLNLVVNGWHAVENRDNGEIKVELDQVEIDTALRDRHPELVDSKYLRLMVTDNGMGMEQEMVKQIFKPFFTTKEEGQGTGVGLSVVKGIVQEHNGELVVESQLGVGSIFSLYLPLVAN
ncbi:MAG: response regulator [Bdellovibrionales bacterium]|nr:response regulator [Bdellovibrionales bacterium]MBT3526662.1 response regulator [Bdellovibrionales bacterium]MBT7669313.1 response regulator [Bdellovibrionales bacterium]MBT7766402.1 response regulator [Bdellovibrionales bacterium]